MSAEQTLTEKAAMPSVPYTRPAAPSDAPTVFSDTPTTGTGQNQPEPETEGEVESFTPNSAAKVDWVLAKIAARRAAAALIRENGEAMAREEEREAEKLEWKYGPAIQTWLNAELAEGKGVKKSKRLYHGVVGYRAKPASVSVTNPTAALHWARASCPAAVTETLDRKALASALLETGEAVGFAVFVPEEETFYIR